MSQSVRVEWPEAAHARIVLARPTRRNALGLAELEALASAVQAIGDKSPRVLSIVAEGDSFSVGGDIEAFETRLSEGRMVPWLREAGVHINAAIGGLHALDAAIVCGMQGCVAGAHSGSPGLPTMWSLPTTSRSPSPIRTSARARMREPPGSCRG